MMVIKMLRLNIKNEIISFVNIRPEQLPDILKWYNNYNEFKYATGVDKPITMSCMMQRYEEAAICSSEFFVGIYENISSKMVGILKGRVKDKENHIVWINSLAIDPAMQGKGYGTLAISLLLGHMKNNHGIKTAYIAVVEDNIQGLKFWRSNGFTEVKRIDSNIMMDGEKHSTIIFQKPI